MARLNINIDEVAAIRTFQGGQSPDPLHAAVIGELAGADGITVHLSEDQHPINKRDLYLLKNAVHSHLNLMIAPDEKLIEVVLEVEPDMITLIDYKNEGSFQKCVVDLETDYDRLVELIPRMQNQNILVSLFIPPEIEDVKRAAKLKADYVELCASAYSGAETAMDETGELDKLSSAALLASKLLLGVSCGAGLDYRNIRRLSEINRFEEFIVGHAVIGRALFVGFEKAVGELLSLVR